MIDKMVNDFQVFCNHKLTPEELAELRLTIAHYAFWTSMDSAILNEAESIALEDSKRKL